jgi:transcriptional regulator with AAA-type ATPase domain
VEGRVQIPILRERETERERICLHCLARIKEERQNSITLKDAWVRKLYQVE